MTNFLPELGPEYAARAAAVGLKHEDVAEHFILGSGHGGQNRNKRATCVQLIHHFSGIEIRCFHKREQHQNRIDAWNLLLTHMEQRRHEDLNRLAHDAYVEKAQKRGRTRAGKRKVLSEKKVRGEIKKSRMPL